MNRKWRNAMNNSVSYVQEYGKDTLFERPFADEDALVLSQFCYLKFDYLVPEMGEEPILLSELNRDPEKENLFFDKRYEKPNRALYDAMVVSRRFRHMKLGYYCNIIDQETESQFSAITFFLDNNVTVVTFRGTDETMVGWQEDFGMMLKRPIPGQTLSVKYLSQMANILPDKFYVTGHSKGGNLSMYSTLCSPKEIQDRVIRIISFDGPGFRPEFVAEHLTEEIRKKAITYIPRSSPVGMTLSMPGDMIVIDSKSVGVLQHNAFNWVIKKGKLVETKLTEQHKLMMKSTNEFLFSLDDEQSEKFVNMLCWMLDATKADTTIEFQDNYSEHFKSLYKAGKESDQQLKDMAAAFVRSYFQLAGNNIKSEVREKIEETLESFKWKKKE